jgi:antitoxin component YwqK of YwqJK toxin-antitoxin module
MKRIVAKYPSGQIKEVGLKDKNGKQGSWTFYNEDGTVSREANYKDDLLHGEFRRYNPNGSIAYYFNAVEGKSLGRGYETYEDGAMREEFISENGLHKPINYWDEKGVQLMKDGTGMKIECIGPGGHQKLAQYYENGVFIKEIKLNDVRYGAFREEK